MVVIAVPKHELADALSMCDILNTSLTVTL